MLKKRPAKGKMARHDIDEEVLEATGSQTTRGVAVIILWIVGLVSLLSFFDLAGEGGSVLLSGLFFLFGWGKFLFPVALFGLGYFYLRPEKYVVRWINYVGLFLFFVSFLSLIELVGAHGGIIGVWLGNVFMQTLGFLASFLILLALIIAALLIMFQAALEDFLYLIKKVFSFFGRVLFLSRESQVTQEDIEDDEDEDEESEDAEEVTETARETDEDVRFDTKKIRHEMKQNLETTGVQAKLPVVDRKVKKPYPGIPLTLLSKATSKPMAGDTKRIEQLIVDTLSNFGIEVQVEEISVGPTVTQYALKPLEPIKLSRVTSLHNELALALAAHPIRIEAPIPGRSLVGIEVPNKVVATVCLREIMDSPEFKRINGNLCISLGKDVSGKVWVGNLETMPHCLIAGATGSGKTVCINTIIMSLLFQYSPDELKLILVDPKRVELPQYNGIPHLLTPVITEVDQTVNSLKWAIHEMERRFHVLSASRKRNIQAYNKTTDEPLPYIVIIIDELADLMSKSAREVEASIIRLAQMARAVGIHLVVATQRPSVDVITGLIKANIPTRIAFSVASIVDSRTILDASGAEKLLGRGDMLFMSSDLGKPKRLQGAFVSDDEISIVVKHLKRFGMPEYSDEVTQRRSGISGDVLTPDAYDDPLFVDAKKVVFEAGKASASLLQRRLRVGYARAARLIDLLEEYGIVGTADGARPRDILIKNLDAHDDVKSPEEGYIQDIDEEEFQEYDTHEEETTVGTDKIYEEDEDTEGRDGDSENEFDEEEYLTSQKGEYLEDEQDRK